MSMHWFNRLTYLKLGVNHFNYFYIKNTALFYEYYPYKLNVSVTIAYSVFVWSKEGPNPYFHDGVVVYLLTHKKIKSYGEEY